MDQPRLDNKTEFVAHSQMLLDHDGEKLVTIVKASFELPAADETLILAPPERARGVRLADIPWGEPEVSSIAYPADLCLRKPGTDVIVVARAYAPESKATPHFDVRVEVGKLGKSLRISGPRLWQSAGRGLSSPTPIEDLDLRYEYAWGGFDDSDPNEIVCEPRNPIGRGVARVQDSLSDQPAPQIEDPSRLINDASTAHAPAGVGAIGRHWAPRAGYAGSYDHLWQESRAPLPPDDLDDRFHLCASPGLTASQPLRGGERVALLNMVPGGGATRFQLPAIAVEIAFRVKGRPLETLRPHLDTVLLDLLLPSEDKPIAVELTWRAAIKAPRRMADAQITIREEDLS